LGEFATHVEIRFEAWSGIGRFREGSARAEYSFAAADAKEMDDLAITALGYRARLQAETLPIPPGPSRNTDPVGSYSGGSRRQIRQQITTVTLNAIYST
jgi:hypothetical protein